MKRITMVFPNGKDTLEIGEDMVAHYEGMGYKVKADKKAKDDKIAKDDKKTDTESSGAK